MESGGFRQLGKPWNHDAQEAPDLVFPGKVRVQDVRKDQESLSQIEFNESSSSYLLWNTMSSHIYIYIVLYIVCIYTIYIYNVTYYLLYIIHYIFYNILYIIYYILHFTYYI